MMFNRELGIRSKSVNAPPRNLGDEVSNTHFLGVQRRVQIRLMDYTRWSANYLIRIVSSSKGDPWVSAPRIRFDVPPAFREGHRRGIRDIEYPRIPLAQRQYQKGAVYRPEVSPPGNSRSFLRSPSSAATRRVALVSSSLSESDKDATIREIFRASVSCVSI